LKAAHTLAPQIKTGTVWFNLHNFVFPSAPCGGYGASGVGSELGKQGLLALTRTKNVIVSLFPRRVEMVLSSGDPPGSYRPNDKNQFGLGENGRTQA
jgi:hypothetical protein